MAVGVYKMEEKVHLIKAPTLVLAGVKDPFSFPRMTPLARSIKGSETAILEEGMVPMVDQIPEAFARIVIDFLGKA